MCRFKIARLDLEAIIEVATSEPLADVAQPRQPSRRPLVEYVKVLVQHQAGIAREVRDGATQIDSIRSRGCDRARMPAHAPGILDEHNACDCIAEYFVQRAAHRGRQSIEVRRASHSSSLPMRWLLLNLLQVAAFRLGRDPNSPRGIFASLRPGMQDRCLATAATRSVATFRCKNWKRSVPADPRS